ncbi:MAG: sulfite reductase flavoprotein subunit alpha [Myxococcota bacterium]
MASPSVQILFGTETGTAEDCANTLAKALMRRKIGALVVDMDRITPRELAQVPLAVVITSTFGDGEPPINAEALLKGLRKKRPDLSGLRFAVMALGDRNYRQFAKCGRDFDSLLGELGGHRLFERLDVDGDPEAPLLKFQAQLFAALDAAPPETFVAPPKVARPGPFFVRLGSFWWKRTPEPDRDHPAEGLMVSARRLTSAKSIGETYHCELDLGPKAVDLAPGDSIGLFPRNAPSLVHAVLDAAGSHDEKLRKALAERCLRRVPTDLLAALGPEGLAIASDPEVLAEFRQTHHVLHALRRFGTRVSARTLLDTLHPLAPRLYSIANAVDRGRVELCVSRIRYELGGIHVEGVASGWLAERSIPGTRVRWYPRRNPAFRLPEDTRPLIVVGPGTGVAPFRGYLQQLARGAPSREVWLFFGHRNRAHDDLYGTEFTEYVQSGVLTRYDAVWSRDTDRKEYVQNRLQTLGDTVWDWLERGARIRVCGDAQGMAPGVRRTLINLASARGLDGSAWLAERKAHQDFLEDVY